MVFDRAEETLKDPGIYYHFKKELKFSTLLLQLQMQLRSEGPAIPTVSKSSKPLQRRII